MQSTATTADEYIAQLPDERRQIISDIRKRIYSSSNKVLSHVSPLMGRSLLTLQNPYHLLQTVMEVRYISPSFEYYYFIIYLNTIILSNVQSR